MSGNLPDRRNWTRSLTVVVVVAVAAVIGGYLIDSNAVETDRKYLRATAGPVLFDHGAHQSEYVASCATCHHPLFAAAQAVSCADCHDDGRDKDDLDHDSLKELHNQDCSQCHEQQAGDEQASSCRQCHPTLQQEEADTVGCASCHDDSYTPEIMSHDEYLEIEEHSCLGCHAPRSLADAYHTTCSNCHLDTSPERFAQADGEVSCGACHLR
jgi:hypothetical protein